MLAVEPQIIIQNNPLPAPDLHTQDMAWFIGKWDIYSKTLTDHDKNTWQEETLSAEHTLEMGGHLIFEHFFGPLNGEPYEAWSLRKYNAKTGKWEQRWVDTSPGGFINWSGQYGDKRFVGYAVRFVDDQLQLTGTDGLRETFDQIEADRFSWRLEQTKDSGITWKIVWTLEYTRNVVE